MPRVEQPPVERSIAALLRVSILAAGAVVIAGACLYLARHGADRPDYHSFTGEPPELRSVGRLFGALGALDGRSIIQLGVVMLIATPIARVAFSIAAFTHAGERRCAAAAAVVLAILIYSLLGAH
jgi:uncharacterized membrane protein